MKINGKVFDSSGLMWVASGLATDSLFQVEYSHLVSFPSEVAAGIDRMLSYSHKLFWIRSEFHNV